MVEEIIENQRQKDDSRSVPAGKGRSIDFINEVIIFLLIRAVFEIECPDQDYNYEREK